MILQTSKGKEFRNVRYCNYLERQQELLVCIDDTRDLLEIGADFHGLSELKLVMREDTAYKETRVFSGFNNLRSIEKDIYGSNKVTMYLSMKKTS